MTEQEKLIAEVEIFVDLVRQTCAQGTMLRIIDENKFGQMSNYLSNLYADAQMGLNTLRLEAMGGYPVSGPEAIQ